MLHLQRRTITRKPCGWQRKFVINRYILNACNPSTFRQARKKGVRACCISRRKRLSGLVLLILYDWQTHWHFLSMLRTLLTSTAKINLAVILLLAVLFADGHLGLSQSLAGTVLRDIQELIRTSWVHWIIFFGLTGYSAFFLVARFYFSQNFSDKFSPTDPHFWLVGLLIIGSVQYIMSASSSPVALTLFAGIAIVQGVSFFKQRSWFHLLIPSLLLVLIIASLWQTSPNPVFQFRYREAIRLTGPWENPNIFGLLMAVGLVLALGSLVTIIEQRFNEPARRVSPLLVAYITLCFLAAGLLGRGLLYSYSRGAWLSAALGVGYYLRFWLRRYSRDWGMIEEFGIKDRFDCRFGLYWRWLKRNLISVVLIFFATATFFSLHFRDAEWHVAKRALSTVNSVDFSWRNRLAAWEGDLKIMAEHPWSGSGWEQAEPLYQGFYLSPKLTEAMAIQMNDYLLLGATLGIPALFCFFMYVCLAFRRTEHSHSFSQKSEAQIYENSVPESWKVICHAGAVVLLVGFWFDGGLFKLPTAAMFWILLGLGIADNAKERSVASPTTNYLSMRFALASICLLSLFFAGLFWAKERDPFCRKWMSLNISHNKSIECVAVLPKPLRKTPVILYAHGLRNNLITDGQILRQMAELGIAVVSLEYNQTNQAEFSTQFQAVLDYVHDQQWADTNTIGWIGFSEGANLLQEFALQNPAHQPKILVQIAREGDFSARAVDKKELNCPTLIVQGDQDGSLSIEETKRMVSILGNSGVPASLKIVPGTSKSLAPNRELIYRWVGEYCLIHLAGQNAWLKYRSIARFQKEATPFWIFCIPIAAFGFAWLIWVGIQKFPSKPKPKWQYHEIALSLFAIVFFATSLVNAAIHLAVPYFSVSDNILMLARKYLVKGKINADFEFLATQSIWREQKLKTLLGHTELAGYNRALINWQVDNETYRNWVLSPIITGKPGEKPNWQRLLWEEFYPRVRREHSPEDAATIVARHLRERITIVSVWPASSDVSTIWLQQLTDLSGFQIIYVAALRSIGVPARLDTHGDAEYFDGNAWNKAPAPAITNS